MQFKASRGFSLVEMLVVLFLFSLIIIIFYETMIGTMRAATFVESHNDLSVISQRVVNRLQTEIVQSRLIFEDDSLGQSYRDLLLPSLSSFPVYPNSQLPLIDPTGELVPDTTGNRMVGNTILFARQLPPIVVTYDHDADTGTPEVEFHADAYRLLYYFLTKASQRSFLRKGFYLDLIECTTQLFADYFQLNSTTLTEPQREQIRQKLRSEQGILLAWFPGKALDAPAFYEISTTGTLSATLTPEMKLSVKSMLPEFRSVRISAKMEYTVGFNSSELPAMKDVVPMYGEASQEFPGGFEVKVVGASGSRKVLVRLVLASEHLNRIESEVNYVITSAKQF